MKYKRSNMRKALVVGINYYENSPALHGCVNDAYAMKTVLERHSNSSKNFDVLFKVASEKTSAISKKFLKDKVIKLFEDRSEIALFYFSGHGYIENTGGYLITSNVRDGDEGLSMNELLQYANKSPAKNKIIILDCCYSGIMGCPSPNEKISDLKEGITILTASMSTQYSMERNGSGVFTTHLVDALSGGAANLLGDITPGSLYGYIDQSLGSWEQRPVFKTNINSFTVLRRVEPTISIADLKLIIKLFPNKDKDFPLDPTYEPTSKTVIVEHAENFKILQRYNNVNLLIPIDEERMYSAAMKSKACRLTRLGEYYWKLVKKERI